MYFVINTVPLESPAALCKTLCELQKQVTGEDIIKTFIWPKISEKVYTRINL